MLKTLAVLTSLLALSTGAAHAGPADDKAEVLRTVQTLLDGWRAADAAKTDSVLAPKFRLYSLHPRDADGDPFGGTNTREELLAPLGKIKPGDWDDRLIRPRVLIDPTGLSVVFADYRFYTQNKLTHCGAVMIQLYRVKAGWKITNFADTHIWTDEAKARADCPA